VGVPSFETAEILRAKKRPQKDKKGMSCWKVVIQHLLSFFLAGNIKDVKI